MKTGPKPKIPICHPDRKIMGHGLCGPCYAKQYYKTHKERLSLAAKKRYLNSGKDEWETYYTRNRDRILDRQRDYRAKNKAEINRKQKLNWSRYKYKISQDQVNKMLADQDNKCIGCQREFTNILYSCVDHCHKTNKIRGMLCDPCNKSLGILLDNPTTLRNLANHLEKYSG